MARRGIRATVLAAVLTLVAGCSALPGLYGTPLPGGPDLGDRPFRVTASFTDVLDLVPQSSVKVADVPVGQVERIELAPDGRTAEVTLVVRGSVELPANAVARLRQSSVLGEKFVELGPPETAEPRGRLADGARIPVARTDRSTEVEEVLGALSLVLNGGGIGQLQQITRELNAALGGRETEIKNLLSGLDTFLGGLDRRRDEISRALDSVAELSGTLAARKDDIAGAIDDLAPGVEALAGQRRQLVRMLTALDSLAAVAVDTVRRGKDDLVADLRALEPILRRLDEAGARLPEAMEILLTFPFPDAALDAVRGDYLNLYLDYDARTAPDGGAG
ncbi:phospholipid/cholesterol/gamma-HCH transport system substrate-binding protein [Prauserella shujinwangii]|uniref:Phospholipid/cholesterol/gamma-HCH transport system substrate-binding protein n=1 Tax=Prauserella shujinwangii TaxID=1453103 RepID=A0A2T0LLA2_9PSEU|nr:MCE family protein [Prauserella shujinwangii]PRX43664.1 phospholipid/cholesterol/gamma-HCH transport system substrate-binding protein [Prauserella shujinwangii]